MKWVRFFLKSRDVDIEEYLELPDQVAESHTLVHIEFKGWKGLRALSSDVSGCKEGHEFVRRPPIGWLVDKAMSLKKEAEEMVERAKRYKKLAEDKGGRREPSQVTWLAGTLFSEQKRTVDDRRKKDKK